MRKQKKLKLGGLVMEHRHSCADGLSNFFLRKCVYGKISDAYHIKTIARGVSHPPGMVAIMPGNF